MTDPLPPTLDTPSPQTVEDRRRAARLRRRSLPRTSELLRSIAETGPRDAVSFDEIVKKLRRRAFGLSLLFFCLPNCFPTPPGFSILTGILIMVVSLQMVAGRDSLMLPTVIGRRTVRADHLRGMIDRIVPYVQRFERLCHPRLGVLTARSGRRVIGALLFLLGFVLMLPIPFLGNMPPGIAGSVMALGIIERDGLIVLAGIVLSVVALAVTGAATIAAAGIIQASFQWMFGG